jgi:DNA-binding response OmpR family regulator
VKRILLVEDEAAIGEPLKQLLEQEGYGVTWAQTAKAARALPPCDLVILDWQLPDGEGLELLKAWRAAGARVPVLFLTARHDVVDKVLGLEMGADDYLTKPFEPRELIARIRVRLRASSAEKTPTTIRHRDIVMDETAHAVTKDGAPVELARMEYALLKLFLTNPGRVFSRDEILNQVWGFEAYPTTRTVDTHVLQLRNKCGADLIETVRGIGYRTAKEEP